MLAGIRLNTTSLRPTNFAQFARVGSERMNRSLLRLARGLEPDLLSCVLVEEQLDSRVIARISKRPSATTFLFS